MNLFLRDTFFWRKDIFFSDGKIIFNETFFRVRGREFFQKGEGRKVFFILLNFKQQVKRGENLCSNGILFSRRIIIDGSFIT